MRATARRSLNIVHTHGDAVTAVWGIAQVGGRFRVANRVTPRYPFHSVSLPWSTLEEAQRDLTARLRHQ